MQDRFPSDCVLLVVQGKDDLGGVLEIFDWGISWEESIPNEEDKIQEGMELNCLEVTGALGEFARPEAEVEAQLDQVGDMSGFRVGGGGCCSHDGVDNAKGGSLFLFYQRILDAVGFKLTGEASLRSSVRLGAWRISRVGEAIREVGCLNLPPRLRNRLFPKLVQASLRLLGILDPVSIYL